MLLEQAYEQAPAVRSGTYLTTVNEFTDQQPALRTELLREACERVVALGDFSAADKLLVEEDKGAILGAAVCLVTGLPLAVARWYAYELPAPAPDAPVISVPIASEYFSGTLYVNGVERGDRVVIVDDTISTGGTLAALIRAVERAGATVTEVLVAVEKPANGGVKRIEREFGISVKSVVQVDVDEQSLRTHVLARA
jgi:adenine phosphoribosyltransferase